MKILVPTDFSQPSKVGVIYAAKLAKELDAELILFHMVHIEIPPMAHVVPISENIENNVLESLTESGDLLQKEVRTAVKGVKVTFQAVKGFPLEDAIQTYAESNEIDLIIIGTKGASGIEKVIFGSNAVSVINKSSIPVISVPEESEFSPWKHIVYATDTHHIKSELKKIIPFAKFFDASIDIFHVLPSKAEKEIDAKKIKDYLIENYHYKKITFTIVHSDEIVESIDEFVDKKKGDLLAIFTHEFSFFEKIFKRSVCREIAFHGSIPLLTIKK